MSHKETAMDRALSAVRWFNTTLYDTNDIRHLYETIARTYYEHTSGEKFKYEVIPPVIVVLGFSSKIHKFTVDMDRNWSEGSWTPTRTTIRLAPPEQMGSTPAEVMALSMGGGAMPHKVYKDLADYLWRAMPIDGTYMIEQALQHIFNYPGAFSPTMLPELADQAIAIRTRRDPQSTDFDRAIRSTDSRDESKRRIQALEYEISGLQRQLKRAEEKKGTTEENLIKQETKLQEIKAKLKDDSLFAELTRGRR